MFGISVPSTNLAGKSPGSSPALVPRCVLVLDLSGTTPAPSPQVISGGGPVPGIDPGRAVECCRTMALANVTFEPSLCTSMRMFPASDVARAREEGLRYAHARRCKADPGETGAGAAVPASFPATFSLLVPTLAVLLQLLVCPAFALAGNTPPDRRFTFGPHGTEMKIWYGGSDTVDRSSRVTRRRHR